MFDQFKEKIQSVQQDLEAGLKSLGEKAREVGRSKKLPGELHLLESKQANLSALKPESVDAGEEILNRFQQLWMQVHINIEFCAEKATGVDKTVQELSEYHEKQIQAWRQLHTSVKDIPSMVRQIQTQAIALGKLEASFEEVESMLTMLEDTCEEEELIKNKKMQLAELVKYRDQKDKERESRKARLMDEYNAKFQRVTQTEDAKKVERQKAFQDVFAADMDHYRTHGKVTRLVSDPSKEQEPSLDDFQFAVDKDDQQALDDFLGPDDGGVSREAVAMAANDADDEEEEESEESEEELTSETEEEERVDVTKMVESRTETGDRVDGTEEQTETQVESSQQEIKVSQTPDADSDAIPTQSQPSQEQPPAKGVQNQEKEEEEEEEEDDFGTPDEDAETRQEKPAS